jgi:hypothetical protein
VVESLKRARHPLVVAGVMVVVVALHGLAIEWLGRHMASFDFDDPMPARIQITYVREMALSTPPPAPAAAPMQRVAALPDMAPVAAPVVQPAASAVPETRTPSVEPAEPASAPREPTTVAQAEPVAVAASEAASAPSAFEWPVSTRMRYELTGWVRGEVQGQAQVEWIRVDRQYQLHLDVLVGMSVAPLATRRMSSSGLVTDQGLWPQQYDQETRMLMRDPAHARVHFEPDRVRLSNGQQRARVPGAQDTASQFVQLAWLFGMAPQRLRVGETVELPVALPRSLATWVYDVDREETLYMPFGEVQAFHLQPRHPPRFGGDMVTEIWVAPQLRYLPVRFRIHADPETWFDLVLDRPPELAAR